MPGIERDSLKNGLTGITRLLDACWSHVRVESVDVTTRGGHDQVRAVIQLGGLTPAHVRVELEPVAGVERSAASHMEHRLFSSHGHGNGCFVFEGCIPRGDSARTRGWMIHVRPSPPVVEPEVEFRLGSASVSERSTTR